MKNKFDINSSRSIISYAKLLENKTLKDLCSEELNLGYKQFKGKGGFGQLLEKYYFGYDPNSTKEPDFKEAGLELKTCPLKILKKGEIRVKERIVLNIINYQEVHKEDFSTSSFWKKNKHLLIVFYLHDKLKEKIELQIKLVDGWRFSKEDLLVIRKDWEHINQRIKEGKAHELSEGETNYIGACTKGATANKSLRKQPFSEILAKQRAYSLKSGYVNHILKSLLKGNNSKYKSIVNVMNESQKENMGFEEIVLSRFQKYIGFTPKDIEEDLGLDLNPKSKNYFSSLTKKILGIEIGNEIAEFEKADIIIKTVRLKPNYLPKEDISFPAFRYEDLVEQTWESSPFRKRLEQKYFFVFYQFSGSDLFLRRVRFWNMDYNDKQEAKSVWLKTKSVVCQGHIVLGYNSSGNRRTNFPKKSENRVSHVRPHARDSNDTYPLPVKDFFTGVDKYTKHSFWLNARYIRDSILEQDE